MSSTKDRPMAHGKVTFFVKEVYFNLSIENYITNKTDVYYLDETWRMDSMDFTDYDLTNNKSFKFILVVFVIFSKFECVVALQNKNAQTKEDSLEKNYFLEKVTKFD